MPKKKSKKDAPSRLWSIRMPEELIERFEHGAIHYGLPVQTYAKAIMWMGLYLEQTQGLTVVGTNAEVEKAVRRNRQTFLKAKRDLEAKKLKTNGNGHHHEPVSTPPPPIRPPMESDDEDEILADAGVVEAPEVKAPEPELDEDEELKNILSSIPG